MKQKILNWLQSTRNYLDGVELYKEFGHNKVLKNVFSHGESEYNMNTLVYELSQIAGISEAEASSMKRIAFVPKVKTEVIPINADNPDDLDTLFLKLSAKLGIPVCEWQNPEIVVSDEHQPMVATLSQKYNELPELQRNIINFRDKYPFLREPNCPNELKIMVADMFAAYDKYRAEKELLNPENADTENFEHARAAVESYLDNRAMWAELDYYKENGILLGEHPVIAELKFQNEVINTSDIDLPKKIGNARSNVTKNRKAVEKATTDADKQKYAENLVYWEKVLALYTKEMERRKK